MFSLQRLFLVNTPDISSEFLSEFKTALELSGAYSQVKGNMGSFTTSNCVSDSSALWKELVWQGRFHMQSRTLETLATILCCFDCPPADYQHLLKTAALEAKHEPTGTVTSLSFHHRVW